MGVREIENDVCMIKSRYLLFKDKCWKIVQYPSYLIFILFHR